MIIIKQYCVGAESPELEKYGTTISSRRKKIVMSNKKFVKQRAKKREQRRYRNRKKNRAPESTVSASATKYITVFLSHTHTDVYVGTHGFLLTQERAVHSCNKGDVRAYERIDVCESIPVCQCVAACLRVCRCAGGYEGGPCVWV